MSDEAKKKKKSIALEHVDFVVFNTVEGADVPPDHPPLQKKNIDT